MSESHSTGCGAAEADLHGFEHHVADVRVKYRAALSISYGAGLTWPRTKRVQLNKRVTRRVADGYEILAVQTRRKVPDLLAEALSLLEEKQSKV